MDPSCAYSTKTEMFRPSTTNNTINFAEINSFFKDKTVERSNKTVFEKKGFDLNIHGRTSWIP